MFPAPAVPRAPTSGIIYNVFYSNVGTMGAEEAGKLAWQVGCVCNCLQGLIEVVLAPIGPYISEFVPMVALLGSLASVRTSLCRHSL